MKGTATKPKGKLRGKALLRTAIALAVVGYVGVFCVKAEAQFAQPLGQPDQNAQYTPPNTAPDQPDPPPPGSGTTAPDLIQGDTGNAPAIPNPGADTTDGVGLSNFTQGQSHDPGIIYLYHQQQPGADGASRGLKMDMTINPATLTSDQWSQINGLIGNPGTGSAATNVQVTDDTLAQIQQILAPYPQTTTESNGLKAITTDSPAKIPNAPTAHYQYDGTLPTVRTFGRFLVILGVVFATVWMALAAYGMVLGHPYAGSRVVGTAGGLMILLCAFTIWKIVRMNTFNDNTIDDQQALIQNEHFPSINPATPTSSIALPTTSPAVPAGTATRGGLPVQPLYGKGN
ncbi:MAG TPA: hypothetical protein V6C97_15220 [Oculatellaceae cyanobacterium]